MAKEIVHGQYKKALFEGRPFRHGMNVLLSEAYD